MVLGLQNMAYCSACSALNDRISTLPHPLRDILVNTFCFLTELRDVRHDDTKANGMWGRRGTRNACFQPRE